MNELKFCPNCGHSPLDMREEGGRLRQVCPNCGYIHFVNPIPAVGILIEKDGGVVLIKRSNPPHKDEWTLPSGFIELAESAEEAAIREAEEETGLKVEIIELAAVNSFPEGPPASGIIIFFRARPVGGVLQGGDDASEAKVYQPDAIPRLPFRTHREMIAQWLGHDQHANLEPADRHLDEQAFNIRPAEAGDMDELRGLLMLIPANRDIKRDHWAVIQHRFREPNGFEIFVAQSRQTPPIIIGFIALSIMRSLTVSFGVINDMAVLPTYQRRGVGAALLNAVMQRSDRLNLNRLLVNTERASESTRAFYAALGFDELPIMHLRLK
jgi:ADP-ribose pyrophosphatase YjhB (NUDIX family)/N-acetylglutamate synthase-like GNAT family acetyltransferase